jgi:hypothetical protein
VLVPNPLPVVTSLDPAHSDLILIVLLGLALRAALRLIKQSNLSLGEWWRRGEGR